MWHLSEQIHQTTLEQREQSTAACCAQQSDKSGMQSSRSFAPFDEIVLASGSPRRREILQAIGVPVTVRTFDTPEDMDPAWTPQEAVCALARRKAQTARERLYQTVQSDQEQEGRFKNNAPEKHRVLILEADTLVALDGKVLGKPRDAHDAIQMLQMLSGRAHQVYTGMAAADMADGDVFDICSVSTVYFRTLTEQQIKRYVASGEPMDKAGAYGIQGQGAMLVERMDGDFFGVMGLSVYCLHKLLWERFGLDIFCCAQGSQGSQQRFE